MADTLTISARERLSLTESEIQSRVDAWAQGREILVLTNGGDLILTTDQPLPEPPVQVSEASGDVQQALEAAATVTADALEQALSPFVDKVEQARDLAARLEQENAEALKHLAAMVKIIQGQGTTWAKDTEALLAASAFLDALL